MSTPNVPNDGQAKKVGVPRWMAVLIALVFWFVGVPLFYGILPWAISLLTPHYAWQEGKPGVWNLLGLIPAGLGIACLIWIMILHFSRTPEIPERIELERTSRFLLLGGPYAFTRNPM